MTGDAGGVAAPRSAGPPVAVLLLGGYLVWTAAFVAIYGLHGLACAVAGDSVATFHGLLAGVWLAHVAAGVALAYAVRRWAAAADDAGTGRFVARVALTLAVTGAAATAWTGLPLLLTDACEPPPRVEALAGHGHGPAASERP